jgi:hypothetical protein
VTETAGEAAPTSDIDPFCAAFFEDPFRRTGNCAIWGPWCGSSATRRRATALAPGATRSDVHRRRTAFRRERSLRLQSGAEYQICR